MLWSIHTFQEPQIQGGSSPPLYTYSTIPSRSLTQVKKQHLWSREKHAIAAPEYRRWAVEWVSPPGPRVSTIADAAAAPSEGVTGTGGFVVFKPVSGGRDAVGWCQKLVDGDTSVLV
jgi:hypothetical protein